MSEPRPAILVIEDEPEIRRFLRASLAAEGYRVVEAASGERGAIDAGTHKPDMAIVDLGLPDLDGVEVIRRIRAWSAMPIVVLSARVQERSRSTRSTPAPTTTSPSPSASASCSRASRALRNAARSAAAKNPVFEDTKTDLEKRLVLRRRAVHLTPIEFKLVVCLAKHLGMVVPTGSC
jgi:two-component system KDP operon response regulator KdpE